MLSRLFQRPVPQKQPLFAPGSLQLSEKVHWLASKGLIDPLLYVQRHVRGDWGDLDEADRRQNDAALASGEDRLFSSYQVDRDLKLWVITEWDRSVTTMLLPEEY